VRVRAADGCAESAFINVAGYTRTESVEMSPVCSAFFFQDNADYGCALVQLCGGNEPVPRPTASPWRTPNFANCPPSYYDGLWAWPCVVSLGRYYLFGTSFRDCLITEADMTGSYRAACIEFGNLQLAWVEDCGFRDTISVAPGACQTTNCVRTTFRRCCFHTCVSNGGPGSGGCWRTADCPFSEMRMTSAYNTSAFENGGAVDKWGSGDLGCSDTNVTKCVAGMRQVGGIGGAGFQVNLATSEDLNYLIFDSCHSMTQIGTFFQKGAAAAFAGLSYCFFLNVPSDNYAVYCDGNQLFMNNCWFRGIGMGFYVRSDGTITLTDCWIEAEDPPANVVLVGENIINPSAGWTAAISVCDTGVWQGNEMLGCRVVSFCSREIAMEATRSPVPQPSPQPGFATVTPRPATVRVPSRSAIPPPGGFPSASPSRSPTASQSARPGYPPETEAGQKGGIGTGAIVGIIIAVLVVAIAGVLLYCFVLKKDENSEDVAETTGAEKASTPVATPAAAPAAAALPAGTFGDEDF
jgi:hypothetical protein